MRAVWMVAAASGLVASGAAAQSAPGEAVLQSFTRCRAITAPEARLACFEEATNAFEKAVGTKEVTVLDKQEVRKAKRSLFGFTLPRIGLFSADRDDERSEQFATLETTIAGVRAVANGRFELTLAEGDAVWATTDPMAFAPHSGAKVRIRRGALGNYFIAIAGERTVRGMRVR